MKQLIEFKKQREIGDILSDTFAFLRHEFKPFFGTILKIAGPYFLLFIVSLVWYMYIIGDMFNFNINSSTSLNNFSPLMMFLAIIAFSISALLAYVFANSAALHYIKHYIDSDGEVDLYSVKKDVNTTFWSFLGLGILKAIALIVAAMLCVLPILYMIVPMAVVFSILVFERKSVMDSFSDSFSLIKDEFLMTFLAIFVVGIIVTVASYAFALPASIYSIIKMGLFSGEVNPGDFGSFFDPVYIILNVLSYGARFLLNLISVVAGVFIYFNLNERKNFTGTYEAIERLGNTQE